MTRALDIAISTAAKTQIAQLSHGLRPHDVARRIQSALQSLSQLQDFKLPKYDAWDAVFYSLWYQPTHINLAYTLLQQIPRGLNPIVDGKGCLHIVDFGCGSLAMQFGLAMAMAEAMQRNRELPIVVVTSEDASQDMKDHGELMWDIFVSEISRKDQYRELDHLRIACREIITGELEEARWICNELYQEEGSPPVTWLTALHVAYEESAESVQQSLEALTHTVSPNIILITSHEATTRDAFSPSPTRYRDSSARLSGADLVLAGRFSEVSNLRSEVYERRVFGLLEPHEDRFAANYLRKLPTSWATRNFNSSNSLYTNRRSRTIDLSNTGIVGSDGWSGYVNDSYRDWN